MITTTLNKIRGIDPSGSDWTRLVDWMTTHHPEIEGSESFTLWLSHKPTQAGETEFPVAWILDAVGWDFFVQALAVSTVDTTTLRLLALEFAEHTDGSLSHPHSTAAIESARGYASMDNEPKDAKAVYASAILACIHMAEWGNKKVIQHNLRARLLRTLLTA